MPLHRQRPAHSDADTLADGKDPVQALLARVDELLEANSTPADSATPGVTDRIRRQAHHLRRMARSRNVKRVAARADRYVHHNAWKTIGLAVVIGAVAGALSSASTLRR